jgi:hypothetical protein
VKIGVGRRKERPAGRSGLYGDTLGVALMQEDDFAAVFDLNGTKLRISEVADHAPQSHTVLGWEVADILETAKAL